MRPDEIAESRCRDEQPPVIDAALGPDVHHRDGGAVTLGDVDTAGDGDAVANHEVVHRAGLRMTVVPLDEQAVVAGDPDRATVAGADLVAALRGRVADEVRGLGRRDGPVRREGRHLVAVQLDVTGVVGDAEPAGEDAHPLAMQLLAIVVEHLLIGHDGVEDPGDSDLDAVLAVVGERQGLGEALRLVVDPAGADRVDVAPVGLRLRVDQGVAVDLGGRGEQDARALVPGQAERLVGAERADLHGLDRPAQVVDRRGR